MPDITPSDYDRLTEEIASDDSPVGIDAEKTHVLILHQLENIQKRLARIEAKLEESSEEASPEETSS